MTDDASLIDYYAKRANEYERIYQKPERQNDLEILRNLFRKILAGKNVLEIACGTGYWTQVISQTANSITATDINEEVLQIARTKIYGCTMSVFKRPTSLIWFRRHKIISPPAWRLPGGRICDGHKLEIFCSISTGYFPRARCWFSWTTNLFRAVTRPSAGRMMTGTLTKCESSKTEMNMKSLRIFRTKVKSGPSSEILRREICWTELTYYWFLTYKIDQ